MEEEEEEEDKKEQRKNEAIGNKDFNEYRNQKISKNISIGVHIPMDISVISWFPRLGPQVGSSNGNQREEDSESGDTMPMV